MVRSRGGDTMRHAWIKADGGDYSSSAPNGTKLSSLFDPAEDGSRGPCFAKGYAGHALALHKPFIRKWM